MNANPGAHHTGGPAESGAGGAAGGSGGGGGPCGACKFLRRKCVAACIFAPYFNSERGASHFAMVHKVFGASNVSKLLLNIPVHKRLDAVVTICYEAQARLRDPVHGCVAHLFVLQQQVVNLQAELSYLQAHLASLEVPTPPPPPQPPNPPAGFSIANLPTTLCFPANYDFSTLFDPMIQSSAPSTQPHQAVPMHFGGSTTGNTPLQHDAGGDGGSGDLHELARELLQRQNAGSSSEASTLPPHDI